MTIISNVYACLASDSTGECLRVSLCTCTTRNLCLLWHFINWSNRPSPTTEHCILYTIFVVFHTVYFVLYTLLCNCILCATLDNFFFDKNQRDRNRRSQMISITIVAQEFCAFFSHIFRYSLISPIMISFSDIGQSDIPYSPSDRIYPESDQELHETFLRLPGSALLSLFRNP